MTRREFFAAGAGRRRRRGALVPGLDDGGFAAAAPPARNAGRSGPDRFPDRRRQEVPRAPEDRSVQGPGRPGQAELQHLRRGARFDPRRHAEGHPRARSASRGQEPGHRRPERAGADPAGLREEGHPGPGRRVRRQAPQLRRARPGRLRQGHAPGLALEGRLPRRPAGRRDRVRRLHLLSQDPPVRRRVHDVAQELRRRRAAQGHDASCASSIPRAKTSGA
ncbi:MAG: hypothetical protein MZU84_09270 [Sphingobacterium sp.]|nr:hypothetical protein [Sphingobacterium sp.]